ncbi:MAG: thiolase family protein [Actinophytocola sp.]|uniref:thiolase family protein n=1 Tax=Actinophytocola sp. TaxID=1872138 RepID=UPI00132AC911|nr:thiolase family protein [Actinophytocola sp.]MPZ82100.1 thiolase family protein [Actinophytocola sp.]
MAAEAARRAIADAGLSISDIDGALDLRRSGGGGDRATYTDVFTRVLGIPANFYFTVGRGGTLAGLAVAVATSFLDHGQAKYILCVGAVDDLTKAEQAKAQGHRGMNHVEKEGYWGKALGDLRAVSHHSWMAARHMAEFGTTSRQLGAISVAERAWANMNPEARMYGRPMTIEDHQNSPWVVEPYHLFDISLISDGAVAFILTTEDRAKDRPHRPVHVLGQGFAELAAKMWWKKTNYIQMAVKPARDMAFEQAGIQLKDIDCAQLYDCFTGEVLIQLEDYGWCEKGDGGPFVEAGNTAPGGTIPVNTGGGLLSNKHLGDLVGFTEAVTQLRGTAGERQVPDCEIAITTGHGGELVSPGMCSIHTTTVLGTV